MNQTIDTDYITISELCFLDSEALLACTPKHQSYNPSQNFNPKIKIHTSKPNFSMVQHSVSSTGRRRHYTSTMLKVYET